jgi:hypothetical protein
MHARVMVVGLVVICSAVLGLAHGQQIHRNRFETQEPAWVRGTADVAFRELAHGITDSFAHSGQFSEHLQLTSEQGTQILYYYPTSRAPVNEELAARVWIRANRPGIQLMARLVLPKERNPRNLDEPLTTLLRGDVYQTVSRWQPLELRRPARLATQAQQQMRVELNRDVDFTDAYVDRLVLNVYAGPGLAELWIDDLEIGPVEEAAPVRTTSRPAAPVKLVTPSQVPQATTRGAVVEMDHDQLLVNGKRFFMRGIRHSDTPLEALRYAGFNTVWFDHAASPAELDEAIRWGFWLVPALSVAQSDTKLTSSDSLRQEMTRFLEREGVLFWDLGGGLTDQQVKPVTDLATTIRAADPQRPIGADVWDSFGPYSLNLDMLGAHRWPLMTGMELPQYRTWLKQRRLLGRPRVFLWTWVQTHLPDWFVNLVYEHPAAAGFDEPVGPQPEQIRLLTYAAISAGCKGIGFWSDRFLADSHQGRDRLLMLALLNLELRMLEPLLVTAEEPGADDVSWVKTSNDDVKAAVLHTKYGTLVLPMWLAGGSQFVPKQAAATKLTITVPQVPTGSQPWQVSPGEVRALRQERTVGGTQVTIPEFGLTTAVVFAADSGPDGIVVRLQDQCRQTARVAAQWARELAEEELKKVVVIEEQLEKAGHTLPDGQKLVENARNRLKTCDQLWKSGDYREADAEAERVMRPLRILMRAQWENAVKELDTPVASPYAVSFYTLPRHWRFMDLVHQGTPGTNLLPHGDFESMPEDAPDAWRPQWTTLDNVSGTARLTPGEAEEGRQCLMLQIKPKNSLSPPEALERTFLAVNSPLVRLAPGALVRISGWVRIPSPIVASADGALFYDTAGGEALAVRLTGATKPRAREEMKTETLTPQLLNPAGPTVAPEQDPNKPSPKKKEPPKKAPEPGAWQQFTLYRRVPSSGTIGVTVGLTGLGTVYFDDVRIEPLLWNNTSVRADGNVTAAPTTPALAPKSPSANQ